MKILHTSDWHLGQNFMGRPREQEHEAFLVWLRKEIEKDPIDILVIAGDIFDTATPPNYAFKLYYRFLYDLSTLECNHIVIIAGNHDSVATLSAPKELLSLLNVTVIAEGDSLEDEILLIKDKNNIPRGILCGVPFLRDRVIRKSVPGETYEEKNKALLEGVRIHYKNAADKAEGLRNSLDEQYRDIPIVATGHLYTSGASVSDSERELYIGSLSNLDAASFPPLFDYIALGHLHRQQRVGKTEHIRYSGSPIPLSFSEAGSSKKIISVTLEGAKKTPLLKMIEVPHFRHLGRIKTDVKGIFKAFKELPQGEKLIPWLEVVVKGPEKGEFIHKQVMEAAGQYEVEVLAVKHDHETADNTNLEGNKHTTLRELSPEDVFKKRLEEENLEDEELKNELLHAYDEIVNQVVTTSEVICENL